MTKQNRAELAKLKSAQGTLGALLDIANIRRELDKARDIQAEMTANWRQMQALRGK